MRDLQALADWLQAELPQRLVTRSWCDSAQRPRAELERGVLTLISQGASQYADYPGREAQLAQYQLALVAQCVLPESADGGVVEAAELDLIAEIEAVLGRLPPVLGGLSLSEWRQSGQLDAPYGWVAFSLIWSP